MCFSLTDGPILTSFFLFSLLLFFFFNDTATTEIYTLSLHDALPISPSGWRRTVPWSSTPTGWRARPWRRAATGWPRWWRPSARRCSQRTETWTAPLIDSAAPDAVIVNDVPLLVEAGLAAAYDLVIVVLADEATRVRRLAADRGMDDEEAYARIRAQASDEQRRAVADVVIVNDGSLADLVAQVDAVWNDRIAPMRAAARGGGS